MFSFISRLRKADDNDDVESRLNFSKKLQAVTNKIHATSNLDQLMLDLTQDICDLFNCDRLTLYALSQDKEFIFSKIKTGINTNNDLVLPMNDSSIAGWVAQTGNSVRIHDAYNKSELKAYAPGLAFNREVDRLIGYRTKQMLAAPLFKANTTELLGVIQLLNNRDDDSFTASAEHGLNDLCETMAIAFTQRMKQPAFSGSKYDALIADAVIAQPEMELVVRSARRQSLDVEDVLIDEFQVKVSAVGQALAHSFNLPYEGFNPKWKKPEQALQKIGREFVEINRCLPIEDDGKSMIFIATDPERLIRLGIVKQKFPYASLFYRVTTNREFKQAVELFFGAAAK
jgi:hypothetical protein